MQSPAQIEFDGLPPSDAVIDKINSRLDHLERLFPRVIDARVVVRLAQGHHRKGNVFQVRIELSVPGDRLIVSREPGNDQAHTDAFVALRDAFDAMQRMLQDYARRMRREVKHHDTSILKGKIQQLFPYEGFGFIGTDDGREIFFDANAVIDRPFDKLEVGAVVRFCEEQGDKGPQASTVYA